MTSPALRPWLHRCTLGLWLCAGVWPVLAGAAGAASPPALAASPAGPLPAVRFAPEADYGPFVYRATDGHIRGLSVDMLERVAAQAGLTITTLPARPLAEHLAAAQRGELDLISSLRPTPERAAYLAFTRPYVEVPAIVVGRRGAPVPGLDDLAGQVVAVGAGYAVEGFVRQRYPKVRWLPLPDDKVALQRLQAGTVAAVVADAASVRFIIEQEGLQGLVPGPAVGFRYALSFAYRKELTALGAALERGLSELSPQERQQLLMQWLPADATTSRDERLLGWSAVAVAGLLGGLLLVLLRRARQRRAEVERAAAAAKGDRPC